MISRWEKKSRLYRFRREQKTTQLLFVNGTRVFFEIIFIWNSSLLKKLVYCEQGLQIQVKWSLQKDCRQKEQAVRTRAPQPESLHILRFGGIFFSEIGLKLWFRSSFRWHWHILHVLKAWFSQIVVPHEQIREVLFRFLEMNEGGQNLQSFIACVFWEDFCTFSL